MSTDRELLGKAAKAVGIPIGTAEGEWSYRERGFDGAGLYENNIGRGLFWNPLRDDGDALRLAVKLRLDVLHNDPQDNDAWVMVQHMDFAEDVDGEASRPAATRRAIVRAAAAMGEKA